jgi:hypothetical protein
MLQRPMAFRQPALLACWRHRRPGGARGPPGHPRHSPASAARHFRLVIVASAPVSKCQTHRADPTCQGGEVSPTRQRGKPSRCPDRQGCQGGWARSVKSHLPTCASGEQVTFRRQHVPIPVLSTTKGSHLLTCSPAYTPEKRSGRCRSRLRQEPSVLVCSPCRSGCLIDGGASAGPETLALEWGGEKGWCWGKLNLAASACLVGCCH